MTYAPHFWYDGHHGHIECVGRERYKSYLNGEHFENGSNPHHMKGDLLDEMKYRVEREPEFSMVCYGVLQFLDLHVPGRNDENDWVLFDAVEDEVVLNDFGLALDVMHALDRADYIEFTKAYQTPNYQHLLRPTVQEMPESEELSGSVTNMWNEYES